MFNGIYTYLMVDETPRNTMVGPVSQIMWEDAHSTHIYQILGKRWDQCNLLKDIKLMLMIQ